jgi:hypothetical protein
MTNMMQCYTDFYFCKLFYMLRVDPPPIIRSLTLYLQRLVFVKTLLLPAVIVEELELHSSSSTIAAGSSNGLTNTRCCRYSVVLLMMGGDPPETCRAVYRNKKNCIMLHLVGHILEYIYESRRSKRQKNYPKLPQLYLLLLQTEAHFVPSVYRFRHYFFYIKSNIILHLS